MLLLARKEQTINTEWQNKTSFKLETPIELHI
jgi:hypothetical protein